MHRNIVTVQRTFLLKHLRGSRQHDASLPPKCQWGIPTSKHTLLPDHSATHGIQGINVEASIPPALSSDLVKCHWTGLLPPGSANDRPSRVCCSEDALWAGVGSWLSRIRSPSPPNLPYNKRMHNHGLYLFSHQEQFLSLSLTFINLTLLKGLYIIEFS